MRRSIAWATLLLAGVAACSRPQVRPEADTVRDSVAAPSPAASATQVPAGAATADSAARAPTGPSPAASTAAASAAARADTVWVDVRTPEEYAAGHVARAVNIPYDQMERRWTELEPFRARPIVVYCRSGRRAGIALQVLQTHGFAGTVNGGGLEALRQAGVPVAP